MTMRPMTDAKHTAEPWLVMNGLHYFQIVSGKTSIGKVVRENDAVRIVACVNALAGVADPAKLMEIVRAAVEAEAVDGPFLAELRTALAPEVKPNG